MMPEMIPAESAVDSDEVLLQTKSGSGSACYFSTDCIPTPDTQTSSQGEVFLVKARLYGAATFLQPHSVISDDRLICTMG